MLAHDFHFLCNRFLKSDLRLSDIGLNFKFSSHAIYKDLKVELTHPAYDRLACFGVVMNPKRRIFLFEAAQRHAELLLVHFRNRLDRHIDNGLGELHSLKHNRILFIANGVTGFRFFKTHHGADVARPYLIHNFLLIGVHSHKFADALFFIF